MALLMAQVRPLRRASKVIEENEEIEHPGELPMYTALLSPQPDPAGGYTVSIPCLPGVVSEGDTRHEALANVLEAAGLWIRDALASGEPIPPDNPKAIAEAVQLVIEDRRAENWPIALELVPVDVSERSQAAA